MADWTKIDFSQNSGIVPPMWNMESGGSKPTNLSKEQILANALNDYRANLPETFTKVICNDGSTKNQLSSPTDRYSDACRDNGGRAENQPVIKQLQSKEEVAKRIDEEIAKIKFPLKTTLITSAVPLGLAYYSYYNNYSLTKGIGVVVIGSVVAFYGAIILSGKGGFV